MRKVVWSTVFLAIVALWILPGNMTLPFFHLIVLGVIPGTTTETGLILPLILAIATTFFLVRWILQVSEDLMEFKTKTALAEREVTGLSVNPQHNTQPPAVGVEEIDLLSI